MAEDNASSPTASTIPNSGEPNSIEAAITTLRNYQQPPSTRWNVQTSFETPFSISIQPLMKPEDIVVSRRVELHKVHLIAFELQEGDTLVFVDLPGSARTMGKQNDCDGFAFHSAEFRVHSEKLLKTGSSKFKDMLGPTYQHRIRRRRRLVNGLPAGVKFVLDVSPPSEGDDLVFQMMELSLTPGLIKWWMSEAIHDVDGLLVSGHDDVCSCFKDQRISAVIEASQKDTNAATDTTMDTTTDTTTDTNAASITDATTNVTTDVATNATGLIDNVPMPKTPDQIMATKAAAENEPVATPNFRNIPDYCPVRHCNAILRLFLFIEGKGLALNSAPRVWTLVKVAQFLDCAMILRDQVAPWIMHSQNTRFIEVLPEEALQLGFTLELPQITDCAFRILVNELALMEARSPHAAKQPSNLTIFGRKRGDLPDEMQNLVQHAARALVDRISEHSYALENLEIFLDSLKLNEWERFRRFERLIDSKASEWDEYVVSCIKNLKLSLLDEIDISIGNALGGAMEQEDASFAEIDKDRALYVEPKDYQPSCKIFDEFNTTQMLLCPMVYKHLNDNSYKILFGGNTPESVYHEQHRLARKLRAARNAVRAHIIANPHLAMSEDLEFGSGAPDHPSGRSDLNQTRRCPVISLLQLNDEISEKVYLWTNSMRSRHQIEPPPSITQHMLLTLTMDELKYLPLWAGGLNDETGGVFEGYVPETDMGPNGPGPAYHTGYTLPSAPDSISSSLMDGIEGMQVRGSTVANSVDVHDSISTVYHPDRIIVKDVSVSSESFTAGGSEYEIARYEIPAGHQGMSTAISMVVDEDMSLNGGESEVPWEDESDTETEGSVIMMST